MKLYTLILSTAFITTASMHAMDYKPFELQVDEMETAIRKEERENCVQVCKTSAAACIMTIVCSPCLALTCIKDCCPTINIHTHQDPQ